jgi:alpha-galactosidase
LYLPGAWSRERHVERSPLGHYRHVVESRRGASSHQENPFLALLAPDTDETHGQVYAMSLIYSGSFQAFAEVDQFDVTRMAIGLNPFDFSWELAPGEAFQTPEAVLLYTDEGLGQMSRSFHALFRKHLLREPWCDTERPILVNNWEATYFNFDEEKLCHLIDTASDFGMELMVLDDGWFGHRNGDDSSLGDWVEDRAKLPHGLACIADHAKERGIQFGLWFEPEMVSRDSRLYREHSDWVLSAPGRPLTEGRGQYVLDLTRPCVQDYVIEAVASVLKRVSISYVKWDMNRHMTEVYTASLPARRQKETAHRYMLGLYRVLESLHEMFPEVLFESCSGGGGRFDPGMLYYMPQTWASDDSDAVERLAIQYGTSLVYPPQAMGAHVSAVPNHQTGRCEPMATRVLVAMAGTFGYELDITTFSEEERQEVREHIALFKELRSLLFSGELYRLLVPEHHGDAVSWMMVSKDKTHAFLSYVQLLATPNPPHRFLHLQGLDPHRQYRLFERLTTAAEHFPQVPANWPDHSFADGAVFGGDELMRAGIWLPVLMGDYQSFGWELKAVEADEFQEGQEGAGLR